MISFSITRPMLKMSLQMACLAHLPQRCLYFSKALLQHNLSEKFTCKLSICKSVPKINLLFLTGILTIYAETQQNKRYPLAFRRFFIYNKNWLPYLVTNRMGLLFTQEIIFPNIDILTKLPERKKDTPERNCSKASTKKGNCCPT
jgi:hypothetical protein